MTKSAATSPSAAPQTNNLKAKPKATEQPLDLAKLGRMVADAGKEPEAPRPRPAAPQTVALKTELGIRLGAERSTAPVSLRQEAKAALSSDVKPADEGATTTSSILSLQV